MKNLLAELTDSNRTVLLFFLLMGFILYFFSFSNGWTYDDSAVILKRDISSDVENIKNLNFSSIFKQRFLRDVTFYIDISFFGYNARYWHIQNILYHVINAWLLYLLLNHLVANKSLSFAVALIFLVHPLCVEVVAQTSHRKDSLALLFSQLSLLSFIGAGEYPDRRVKYYLLCLFCVVIALVAKQNAIAILGVIVCYHFTFAKAGKNRAGLAAAILGLSLLLAVYLLWYTGADNLLQKYEKQANVLLLRMNYVDGFSYGIYFLTLLKSWAFIFARYFFPVGLAVNYVFPVPLNIFDPWVLLAIALLAFYAVLLVFGFCRDRVLFFGLVWFGLAWLPTSNLWPFAYLAADRYAYFPLAGLLIVVAALVARSRGYSPQISGAFLCTVILVFSLLTGRQILCWRDNPTLWRHSLAVNPQSAQATVLVGYYDHYLKGDFARALQIYDAASQINPLDPMPASYRAVLHANLGDDPEACRSYREVVHKGALFPDSRYGGLRRTAIKRIKQLNCD